VDYQLSELGIDLPEASVVEGPQTQLDERTTSLEGQLQVSQNSLGNSTKTSSAADHMASRIRERMVLLRKMHDSILARAGDIEMRHINVERQVSNIEVSLESIRFQTSHFPGLNEDLETTFHEIQEGVYTLYDRFLEHRVRKLVSVAERFYKLSDTISGQLNL
jgi:septation ring formation regulator EzrA